MVEYGCDRQPGDQVADTDGLARERIAAMVQQAACNVQAPASVAPAVESVFWFGPDGLAENGKALNAPTELRPPPEHAGKLIHWLRNPRGAPWVAQWHGGMWQLLGAPAGGWLTPKRLATDGYRYLGPAEWREPETYTAAAREFIERQFPEIVRQKDARIAELEAENASIRRLDAEKLRINQKFAAENQRLVKRNAWLTSILDDVGGPVEAKRLSATWEHLPDVAAPPVAPPRPGEFVTCEAGHLICEVATPPADGPQAGRVSAIVAGSHVGLTAWRVDDPTQAATSGACPCGAAFCRPVPGGAQIHIKGRGWV